MHPRSFHHILWSFQISKISIQQNVTHLLHKRKDRRTRFDGRPADRSILRSPELGFSCRGRLLRGQDLNTKPTLSKNFQKKRKRSTRKPRKRWGFQRQRDSPGASQTELNAGNVSLEGPDHECLNMFKLFHQNYKHLGPHDMFVLTYVNMSKWKIFQEVGCTSLELADHPIAGSPHRHHKEAPRTKSWTNIVTSKRNRNLETNWIKWISNKRTRLRRQVISKINLIPRMRSVGLFRWGFLGGFRCIAVLLHCLWLPTATRSSVSRSQASATAAHGFAGGPEHGKASKRLIRGLITLQPRVCWSQLISLSEFALFFSVLTAFMTWLLHDSCHDYLPPKYGNDPYPIRSMGFTGLLAIIVWTTQSNLRNGGMVPTTGEAMTITQIICHNS